MFRLKNMFKTQKNTTIPEYEEHLAIYTTQFSKMTAEQLKEENKDLNHSGLSIMQKIAKSHALKSELERRNLK